MKQPSKITLGVSLTLISLSGFGAEGLSSDGQECAIATARATVEQYQCLANARAKGIEASFAENGVTGLLEQCMARYSRNLEEAEARAVSRGGQCDRPGNASLARQVVRDSGFDLAKTTSETDPAKPGKGETFASNTPDMGACRTLFGDRSCPWGDKPRIPKQDFEWNGTFKVKSLGVSTDLVIRGKWQGRYFDLYMAQGSRNSRVWVENLIYQDKLYTITHKWPGGVKVPGCYRSRNDITVDDLNGILRSSRLVGPERINGVRMNHFRATCLSETTLLLPSPFPPLTTPLQIFSDIYVRPGRPTQFERWLQFGDGVGLDPQRDEWFFLEKQHRRPGAINLPWLCEVLPLPVEQKPCSNLPPN